MRYEEREFTTHEIEQLLADGGNYRSLSEKNWRRYLRDMLANRWSKTGVPILLDQDGKLMDGQHRLRATLEFQKQTGLRMRFLVVSGVERKAEAVIDGGAKRTIGHYLAHRGARYATSIGSLLQVEVKARAAGSDELTSAMFTTGSPSVSSMIEVFEEKGKEIQEWCQRAYSPGRVIGAPGLLATVTWFIAKKNQHACMEFLDLLDSRANLSKHNPILMLRDRLVSHKAQSKHSVIRRNVTAAFIIKAWNAWVNESEIKVLRWSQFGASPEAFPTIDSGPMWRRGDES